MHNQNWKPRGNLSVALNFCWWKRGEMEIKVWLCALWKNSHNPMEKNEGILLIIFQHWRSERKINWYSSHPEFHYFCNCVIGQATDSTEALFVHNGKVVGNASSTESILRGIIRAKVAQRVSYWTERFTHMAKGIAL